MERLGPWPGPSLHPRDEDVREAVYPTSDSKADTLLARYLSRWPKQEPEYKPPPWADRVAEEAERHRQAWQSE